MSLNKWLLFASLFLVKSAVASVPDDFKYQNQPIDALCFYNLDKDANTINLKNCGLAKEKYRVTGSEAELIKKGFTGYNWQSADPQFPAQGYSYYKFFPAGNKQYWLYSINSGGGSGEFTTLYLVKRTRSDFLEMKVLMGGDRCNGGLRNVSEKNHQLQFTVNLTAFDFIKLSKKSLPQIKAYDDLAACAVCCVAKGTYQLDSDSKLKLLNVRLQTISHISELPEQGAYQGCFNQLYLSYLHSGQDHFNQNLLDEFADKFSSQCVKKGKQMIYWQFTYLDGNSIKSI